MPELCAVTYAQTLEYLYAQLPMFHRIGPSAYKKDLGNTLALCEMLGNPHQRIKTVHVGGTNGKGSVSHVLAALCQAHGLKTGLYISPHYKDFRERIKINGQYIPKRNVVDFIVSHQKRIEEIQPSFFELCVAMAFDHFAREQVDIAIIEVGLGGRLDSTNVITPLLSVITNISYDHQNLLGDTLPQIAYEKAGIIKPGIPVVIGERHAESAPVFLEKARACAAPIVFADEHYACLPTEPDNADLQTYKVLKSGQLLYPRLETALSGPYQQKNLATALQAWEVLAPQLTGLNSSESGLFSALKNLIEHTRFQGRWQYIGRNPGILCDSAHNEAGLKLAFERLKSMNLSQLHIVCGFVNDKDVDKVLKIYPDTARYYFAKANIPRGLDATLLREKASLYGLHGKAYVSVSAALKAAKRQAKSDDLILVIGSIFVVAEVLP